jgi:transposase-like protein
MNRRVFADEFKREAVRVAVERGNIAATARDLGVSETCLHRWKQRLDHVPDHEVAFPGHGLPRDPELARLRRENTRLKEELDILRNAMGICTYRPR